MRRRTKHDSAQGKLFPDLELVGIPADRELTPAERGPNRAMLQAINGLHNYERKRYGQLLQGQEWRNCFHWVMQRTRNGQDLTTKNLRTLLSSYLQRRRDGTA